MRARSPLREWLGVSEYNDHPILGLLLLIGTWLVIAALVGAWPFARNTADPCGGMQGSERRQCIEQELNGDYPEDY